jgi:hypothetical protein
MGYERVLSIWVAGSPSQEELAVVGLSMFRISGLTLLLHFSGYSIWLLLYSILFIHYSVSVQNPQDSILALPFTM